MNNEKKHYGLTAPQVPLADPVDGLLPAATLNSPIQVDITIHNDMRTGDLVQLCLDRTAIDEVRTIKEGQNAGDIISMHLNEKHMAADGAYSLGYITINYDNGVMSFSPTCRLLIDRTSPGAALLAPMIFASINFGDTLHCTIPGYAGMEPGDIIQTLCNNVEGPAHVVTAENLTESPVRIAFARDFLQGLDSELIRVSYQVTDRAGNQSILAQPVELTLQTSKDDN